MSEKENSRKLNLQTLVSFLLSADAQHVSEEMMLMGSSRITHELTGQTEFEVCSDKGLCLQRIKIMRSGWCLSKQLCLMIFMEAARKKVR